MGKEDTVRYSLEVHTQIHASVQDAWDLLVNPARASELWWGSTVESDFTPGHPIVWKGVWEGKPFEDRGTILTVQPPTLLKYSHWAPSFGEDVEANRNFLTWQLAPEGAGVKVTFRHENIATKEMKDQSEAMWKQLLGRMKDMLEKTRQPR